MLQIVNSARYASVSETTELEAAVTSVGIDEVTSIASTAFMEKIKPPSPIYFKMFRQQIWDHSKQCVQPRKVFATTEGASTSTGRFLGLIHDDGKILIFDCLCKALSGSNYGDLPSGKMFKDIMSEMALDTSYFVSEAWELPEEFQMALQEQRTGVKTPLARTLFKASLCAEINLLQKKKKLRVNAWSRFWLRWKSSQPFGTSFNKLKTT